MLCGATDTTPVGRELAWQSMHEPTGAWLPARSEAWKVGRTEINELHPTVEFTGTYAEFLADQKRRYGLDVE